MPKMKMHRKSTSIDMTAMCDVAFLLLSFFIFTAKFKKSEEVAIVTPNSVSTDSLAIKNKLNVYVNIAPTGEVLVGMDNDSIMKEYAKAIDSGKNLGLSETQIETFSKKTAMGVPFAQLKSYLDNVNAGQLGLVQAGIPVKDSATNEFGDWIDATASLLIKAKNKNPEIAYNIFIKADQKTPYQIVDRVMETFVKKGQDQFKLVTTPKDVPMGTELYINNKAEREGKTKQN
jgi:biopolymer transport protein ExbD